MRISDWSSDVCSSDLKITTDHISPAGSIKKDGPAGKYLSEHGVAYADFNSYGARRGNHEVMMRGHFATIRQSVVQGNRVSVRVDIGGRRSIKKNSIKHI